MDKEFSFFYWTYYQDGSVETNFTTDLQPIRIYETIGEPTPRRQPKRPQTPNTVSIASCVAGAVDNLQRDTQAIHNHFELCRRADMAMVAMLEVVAPLLPDLVQKQVNSLIAIHDTLYQTGTPTTEQQENNTL